MKFNMKFETIAIIALITTLVISACSSAPEIRKYDAFAQSLTDKGVIMYGTEWCSHCQNQKARFGASFDKINFIDCDNSPGLCQAAGVRGYPTWSINGQTYTGEQELSKLAELAGVELVED